MPALDRNFKVTCGNCETSVTKKHFSRHKWSCSGGTLYCPKCPKLFTKSRDVLISHIAKEIVQQDPKTITRVKISALSLQVSFT